MSETDNVDFTPPANWDYGLPTINEYVLEQIHCPPKSIPPEDFVKAPLHGDIDDYYANIQKVYESDLLKIPADKSPYFIDPESIYTLPVSQQNMARDFLVKEIIALLDGEDTCDKVGIQYVGQYFRYFCPQSSAYQQLDDKGNQRDFQLVS